MRVMCSPHFRSLQVVPYQSPIPSLICKQELLGGNVPPLVPGQQPLQRYLIEQYHWCVFLVFFLHTTRVSGLYAGSSLWISPGGCLGLEPKWRWPLWNSKTAHATLLCLRPTDGMSGDLWEWTFFKHQHSPSVPQITMLCDIRVAAPSQKV